MSALLSLSNVTASYGASQALFGVDLDIREGEVMALLGRNGMGKSTTVKCICRMLPADRHADIRWSGSVPSAQPQGGASGSWPWCRKDGGVSPT